MNQLINLSHLPQLLIHTCTIAGDIQRSFYSESFRHVASFFKYPWEPITKQPKCRTKPNLKHLPVLCLKNTF